MFTTVISPKGVPVEIMTSQVNDFLARGFKTKEAKKEKPKAKDKK